MLILTFWEDPPNGNKTGDDFDGILEVRLKSVKEIPSLLAAMPKRCTMVSTEYSGTHLNRKGKVSSPQNPRRFKEIWRKGQPLPSVKDSKCPLCGHVK
jgi:hypothetical protein